MCTLCQSLHDFIFFYFERYQLPHLFCSGSILIWFSSFTNTTPSVKEHIFHSISGFAEILLRRKITIFRKIEKWKVFLAWIPFLLWSPISSLLSEEREVLPLSSFSFLCYHPRKPQVCEFVDKNIRQLIIFNHQLHVCFTLHITSPRCLFKCFLVQNLFHQDLVMNIV